MDLCGLIVNFLLFFGTPNSISENAIIEKTSYYPSYAHQVIDILQAEVEKEYRISCCGHGGSMPTDIRSLSVKFSSKKTATIEEARALLVNIMEKFQRIINEHEDIRPFIRDYPFPIERVRVAINFRKKRMQGIENNDVHHVFSAKGKIFYCERREDSFQLIDLYEEPFEEALMLVKRKEL